MCILYYDGVNRKRLQKILGIFFDCGGSRGHCAGRAYLFRVTLYAMDLLIAAKAVRHRYSLVPQDEFNIIDASGLVVAIQAWSEL